MILRFVLYFMSAWVDLHSWVREPDVEEMTSWEIYVGTLIASVCIGAAVFGLGAGLLWVIDLLL